MSAKPHSMAAQTDAPDDLIAELTRLMADDARKPGDKPAPVRIPGDAAFEASRAALRQDLATNAPPARNPANPSVRIPGTGPETAAPAKPAEPYNFDFSAALGRKPEPAAAPAVPLETAPAPVAAKPVPPIVAPKEVVQPAAEASAQPALDQDSLADLIAAELAADSMSDRQPDAERLPVVEGPAAAEDNFGVPPVFGVAAPPEASRSTAAVTIVDPEPAVAPTVVSAAPTVATRPVAAQTQPDALDDIKRLVEPVLQVGNPKPAQPASPPSPALRSLATPTLPTQAPDRAEPRMSSKVQAGSVDDAILAAAAATGARIEWVDGDHETVPAEHDVAPVAKRRRRLPVFGVSRAVAGPLVAVALLAVAGGGLYWMLGQGAAPTGPAPLIAADTTEIKQVPEPVETEPTQSVVFNEIAGNNTGANEQLVSRDQADEEAVTQAANAALGNTGVIGDTASAGIDPNTDGIVNRKVRTVTVRPDGTIVSGEDSLAGASILPVDRPNVPDVPGADFSTPDLIANGNATAGAATTDPTTTAALPSTPATTTTETSATPAVPPIQPGSTVQVVDASGSPIAGRTVATPLTRPADLAAPTTAAAPAATATTPPAATAATPAATAPAATGTAGAYVQLSSQRTEQAARESAQAIVSRYGPLFGGANLEVQRVDLGERGIFYRVLAPASDRAGASNLCTNLQAAGGDCFVL